MHAGHQMPSQAFVGYVPPGYVPAGPVAAESFGAKLQAALGPLPSPPGMMPQAIHHAPAMPTWLGSPVAGAAGVLGADVGQGRGSRGKGRGQRGRTGRSGRPSS